MIDHIRRIFNRLNMILCTAESHKTPPYQYPMP